VAPQAAGPRGRGKAALGSTTSERREDDHEAKERRAAVRAALDDLPEVLREVFVRVELEHESVAAVARDLGIPVGTGYTRHRLARARFLEALQRFLARRRIEGGDL
jgi:DNA-directed RNA polymerase specialized sigma24 family protein